MAPALLAPTVSAAAKAQMLEAAIITAYYLETKKAVIDFCKIVFGEADTVKAAKDREDDMKAHYEMDGTEGPAPANRTSARVYVLLVDNGEQTNAEEWKKVIVPLHFLKVDFEAEIQNVQMGL